jgi:putative transcriptional regulator
MGGGFDMALKYKIDVLAALKEKGITTYQIRKDRLLSESTVQKLRAGVGVSWENIETLCRLLECQPGDLMEYAPEE